jgi:hypothetical protein
MSEIWLDARTWYYRPSVGNLWQERFRGKLYDSYLGKSSHPTQNHVLRLLLRVYLNPVNKRTANDANKHSFPLKDWTSSGWEKFTKEFEKQSRLWNHRFWLIPPKHFSVVDFSIGRKFVRPNIECYLATELVDSPGKAHRKIDVFNIDVDEVHRRDSVDDDNPRLGKFRSDAHHLNSGDTRTGERTYEDAEGSEYTVKHHYTIAHEVGHALGLKHIGNLKHTERCDMAMKFEKEKRDPKTIDSPFRGGLNAKVCYGELDNENVGIAENIMGVGYKFEEVNASPWTSRLVKHTNTLTSDWKISLVHINPQPISESDRHVSDRKKWVAI